MQALASFVGPLKPGPNGTSVRSTGLTSVLEPSDTPQMTLVCACAPCTRCLCVHVCLVWYACTHVCACMWVHVAVWSWGCSSVRVLVLSTGTHPGGEGEARWRGPTGCLANSPTDTPSLEPSRVSGIPAISKP